MKKRPSWPIATASLLALLSLFSLFDLAVAQQQQPAGVVTGVQGQAQVTRPAVASPVPLRFRDGVIIRDVVDTREKSLARILFGGRSTVTVRELSRLQVTEEILPSGARRDVHDLASGAILVNVARQLMKPGDEVQIRTPNAVAAVRGSTVFGSFNPVLNQSFFAILSGSGSVTPQGLPPVTLTANTSNNGANVSGSGPAVQVTVINVPPAQANQILAESQVAKVVKEEANKEQNVQAATQEAAALVQAVVDAATKTGGETTAGTTQGETTAEQPASEEPSATTAPVTPDTMTTTDNPDVEIAGTTKTLIGTETLKTFSGTGSRSGTSPVVKITDSTVDRASTGNLIQVDSGADWSLAGPLLQITDSTITDSRILNVEGTISSSSGESFISIDPSTITTPGDFITIDGSGSTLSLASALVTDTGGTFTIGTTTDGDFLRLGHGASLSSTSSSPLIQLSGSSVETQLAQSGSGDFVRVGFDETGGTSVDLQGPLVSASDSFLDLAATFLRVVDGSTFTSSTPDALIQLSNNEITVGQDFIRVMTGCCDPTTMQLDGPLLSDSGSTITVTGDFGGSFNGNFLRVKDEATLKSTTSEPLIKLDGSQVTVAKDFIGVSGTPASLDIQGQLLFATGTTVDPVKITADRNFLAVTGGSTLSSQTTSALLQFDNAQINAGTDGLDTHFFQVAGTGSKATLKGPLANATDSTFNIKGFAALEVMSGGTVDSTTTSPFVELTGGSLTLGSNVYGLFMDSGTMTLSGPLFKTDGTTVSSISTNPFAQLTNSTLSIGTDLLVMDGGSLDTSGPLLKITGGSLTLGASSLTKLIGGASLTAGGSLLDMTDLDLDLGTSPVARLEGGSTLKNTAGPVFKISGGSLTADSLASTDGAGNKFELTGSLLDLSNSTTVTLSAISSEPEGSTDTSTLSLGINGPFINVVNSTLKLTGSGEHLVSFGVDSGDPVNQGGVALIASGSTIEVAGPLLDLGGVNLTDTNPQIQLANNTTVTQTGADPLINVTGLDVTTAGPLLKATDSTIDASGPILLVQNGSLKSSSTTSALINIDPSTVKTANDFVRVGSGGSLTLEGQLITDSGGTLTAEGNFLAITGGGTLTSNTTSPLLQFTNSDLTVGTDGSDTHFFQVAHSSSSATLKGPLLTAQDSTFNIKGFAALEVWDSGTVESTTTSPFVELTGGSLTLGSNVYGLWMSSGTLNLSGPLFKADGTTITPGSGVPFIHLESSSSLTTGGPLLDLTNVDLDLGTDVLARLEGGSTLKNTAGPVFKISGGSLKADALGTSDGAGNKFELTGTLLDLTDTTVTLRTLGEDPDSSTDTTTFTLAADEPFIKMSNSTLEITGTDNDELIDIRQEDTGSTFNGVALIATDSTLTLGDGLLKMDGIFSSTSTEPLVQLTNSTLENTSTLMAVEPGSVTDVTLAGQLFKASGSTIKVFNEDKNTVQTNIALSAQPIDSIAVIQDRATNGRLNRAYVPIPGSDLVQVINTDTNTLVTTIPVGDNPVTVRATTNDDRLIVLNSGDSTASIINTHTNTVLAILSVGTEPEEIGFSAHNNRAFIINKGSDDVTVIDLNTNSVLTTIPVGDQPVGGAVSKKGGNAYVTNSGSNNVSVIDTDTGTVVATIPVGTKPAGAALKPDESRLYVINETSSNVSVIDTETNTVIATIPVGTTPISGALTPDGSKGYVVNEGSGTVSVIDTATNTVSNTITVGTSPHDIAMSRDGKRAYVANEGSNTVSVIDIANDAVVATINVGTSPSALALTQDGLQLFVVNENTQDVTSIATVDVADFLEIAGGAKLTGNSASPFLEFNPSTISVEGALVRVDGSGSSLTLAGPLLAATDTEFNVSRGAIRVRNGGTLKGTGIDAFIQLTGTAADQSVFNTTYSFANVEGTGSKLDLAGPLLSAVKTNFSAGVEGDPSFFLFFQEGADVKSTSSSPFVSFDNSTLNHASRFLELARSPDNVAAAANMEIAGPLLAATNNSSFTTDRDFVRVTEKATLKGTGLGSLLQFTGATQLTTTGNFGNADFFLIDDTIGESAQGAGSVELAGGLFSDSGGTFSIADRFLNVRDGGTLTSTSSDPLIQLSGTTLSTERDLVQIDGSGSKIELSGSLLSAGSILNIGSEPDVSGSLLNIHDGGQLVMNSTSNPIILFTGGTHTIGTADETSSNSPNRLVRIVGVNTDLTTGLGTDQPIKGPASTELAGANNPIGTLLKATEAATIEVKKGSGDTSGGNAVRIDTALYEATLPVLDLIGSLTTETTLNTASSTLDIFKSKVVSNGPLVAMDKSFINVTDGPFIHIRNGSLVDVTGDLLKLFNGAKIEVINGPLIKVEGTSGVGSTVSELKVSGALVEFGGSGNNIIKVNNNLCPTGCATMSRIQVKEGSTGSISIGPNPIKNSSLGSIQYGSGSSSALIQTGSTGKVTITAP